MKPYVLGIDIGGTNTVFGIVDARGVVIASSSIKTKSITMLLTTLTSSIRKRRSSLKPMTP